MWAMSTVSVRQPGRLIARAIRPPGITAAAAPAPLQLPVRHSTADAARGYIKVPTLRSVDGLIDQGRVGRSEPPLRRRHISGPEIIEAPLCIPFSATPVALRPL